MMRPDQYTEVVRRRLYAARARVTEEQRLGPGTALVGLLSDTVALSPVTLCLAVTRAEVATAPMLRDFCGHAAAHTRAVVGGGVGLLEGACTIAAVVAVHSDPPAQAAASAKTAVGFGTMLRPVLVDLSTGTVHTWTGTRLLGLAAMGYIRDSVRRLLPPPGEALAELGGPTRPVGPPHPPGPSGHDGRFGPRPQPPGHWPPGPPPPPRRGR
ncbi:hypothetical protein ACQEU5_07555 [Marinactinospora thermotolerans]|uniref:Uncharacterized protein n=1 Tax=Marinactinospora thermotolerans DSM 45154 TaxID=1122192 RepID=A0A1T4R569_9ACTN|nr:hypothetical protein [Marinactinospora thermotolerans]SKA10798.1 hypothetical protein SAMN02745673_02517 [Marinactinospora thermotolerans DSM 45154]